MKESKGLIMFECDKDSKGNEILNSTQRNNKLVYPNIKDYPKAQYITSWKNECNITSMAMAISYTGSIMPTGNYEQEEDNLGYFILTNKDVMDYYKKTQPYLYELWQKSINGNCNKSELNNVYPPTELHDILSFGTNKWMGFNITKFNTNSNFVEALWNNMVKDNLPIVISTIFGGFNHIVCCTGVIYKKESYIAISNDFTKIKSRDITTGKLLYAPYAIIVDDPWGKYNPNTNNYDAPNNGNDIIIPWDIVVKKVKPINSDNNKWTHTFCHSVAIV